LRLPHNSDAEPAPATPEIGELPNDTAEFGTYAPSPRPDHPQVARAPFGIQLLQDSDAPIATHSAGRPGRAGEGLPSSRHHHPNVPRPLRRGVLRGCTSRLFTPSMAFTQRDEARLSLIHAHDAAGFA